MAINFVQSRSVAGASLAFNSNNALANLLAVLVIDTSSPVAVLSCSDSQGNPYIPLPVSFQNSGNLTAQVFYCRSAKAGANTVTAGSSNLVGALAIHEFSGVNTFDQFSSATGSGNAQDSGAATITTAAELLFGFEAGNANLGQMSVSPGAGWTQAESIANTFLTQWQITASPGTFNSTTTTTTLKSGGVFWVEQIATFLQGTISTATPNQAWAFGF